MNGLIQKITRYVKNVVLTSITVKYKNTGLDGRLQYLQELSTLINKPALLLAIKDLDAGQVLSTKYTDIKVYSRNVARVAQALKANQNIEPNIIKTDPVKRDFVSFLMTHDGNYIDPKEHVETFLEYSLQIKGYVENNPDKQSTIYIHNTYLLLYYVEDLIDLTRVFVRMSMR